MSKQKRRTRFLAWIVIIFVGVIPLHGSVAEAAGTQKVSVTVKAMYSYAYEVLDMVNAERNKAGLSSLVMDIDLMEGAMQRATENIISVAVTGGLDHNRPDGSSCFTISAKAFGENLAAGQNSPTNVMNSWMNSTGHRSNILDKDYVCVGVGCVMIDGGYFIYWAQEFGCYPATTGSKPADREKTYQVTVPDSYYSVLKNLPAYDSIISTGNGGGNPSGKTGWIKEKGQWYYYDGNGALLTGWQQVDGKWYYLSDSGTMQKGWIKSGNKWYYLNADGIMVTGWKRISGIWYFFTAGGTMKTGWLSQGGKWYYLKPSGAMQTGSCVIGGKNYHFNTNGACLNP